MKKIILTLILSAFVSTLCSEVWAISWEHDLAGAFEKAKTEGKPVMADFYTDWCGWCKKLDKDVYEDASVNRLAEKFICVKVNCEVDKGAFSKYGLKGYPTIIFFNASGGMEETVVGYRTAQVFADIMSKVFDKMPKAAVRQEQQPINEPVAKEPVIKEKRAAGEFSLAGIMGSKAIVNDRVVVVGDEIDDAKVTSITMNYVKLRYKDKELTLTIQ